MLFSNFLKYLKKVPYIDFLPMGWILIKANNFLGWNIQLENSLHWQLRLFNDTHSEKPVLCWIQYKNSLKYKVGYFWRFHMFRQLILSSFNSIIVQMTEKCDSSNRHWKWMFASFSNFYGKIWVGFCNKIRKRFFLEFSF